MNTNDCWAVGYYYNTTLGFHQTLTLHWDGSAWAVVSSPNPISNDSELFKVSCVSANDCWAVGMYFDYTANEYHSLIQHWDGSAWAIVPSPSPSAGQAIHSFLNSVTCASARDCWAVGGSLTFITDQTLIEHWDGNTWSIVNGPVPGSHAKLNSATCVSGSDCWAVGTFGLTGSDSVSETLIERNTGNGWNSVSSPSSGALQDDVWDEVTCVNANDCWTVGYFSNRTAYQTLAAHWNGSGWALVPTPVTSTSRSNVLNSVSCASGSDCWAVGFYHSAGYVAQTLVQHNTGSGWTVVNSPNVSALTHNYLQSVTCVSANDCWAVGLESTGSGYRTLIQRYTVPTVAPSGVVSRKTHGSAGSFDVDLPLASAAGIECRSGGSNSAHQIVFTFAAAITVTDATVTPASGKTAETDGPPVRSADGKEVTVNLKNVTNAQRVTVTLLSVSDGTDTNDVSVQMGVLLGDTTGDGVVDAGDITQVRRQSGQVTGEPNKRVDISVDGVINSGDITLVRRQSGTALPTP